jgi:hypothetical protein
VALQRAAAAAEAVRDLQLDNPEPVEAQAVTLALQVVDLQVLQVVVVVAMLAVQVAYKHQMLVLQVAGDRVLLVVLLMVQQRHLDRRVL